MAAESYAYNLLSEDLSAQKKPRRTLWLNSNFPAGEMGKRLREDPRNAPDLGSGYCDLDPAGANIDGSLVVGSIVDLNVWLEQHPEAVEKLSGNGVDLVSGGPPCQSFSMAGLRRQDCEKNILPWEFAKFARLVRPKIVLLENVTGILRPFKDDQGNHYHAWFEVAKAFAGIGYVPLCLHVNAKFAGVPQNRPRFILIGVRSDFLEGIQHTFNEHENELFCEPLAFQRAVLDGADLPLSSLHYIDVVKAADLQLFRNSFLHHLVTHADKVVSVKEAIDDLRDGGTRRSRYVTALNTAFNDILAKRALENHQHRSNNELVKRRFRLYQVLQQEGLDMHKRVAALLRGDVTTISESDWQRLASYDYLVESGEYVQFDNKARFISFLKRHATKKQTQKALLADMPAPAALSIPDDACHYHHDELRTLTVREMARIQSFPDSFVFRSKVTTGGKMRQFEVPQYTQVGNAVPPLLGRALGRVVSDLLNR